MHFKHNKQVYDSTCSLMMYDLMLQLTNAEEYIKYLEVQVHKLKNQQFR